MADRDAYGPSLPPGFQPRKNTEDSENVYGPSAPSKSQIGPRIPANSNFEDKDDEEDSDEDTYGPMPPNNDPTKNSSNDEGLDDEDDDDDMYGAALPPHLLNKKPETDGSCTTSIRKQVTVGPCLPPGYKAPPLSESTAMRSEEFDQSDDDDQGVVGPMPSNKAFNEEEYRIREMELRAKRMRDKLEGKGENKIIERESWMLELPEDKSYLSSLGGVVAPRQFRTKTPGEKGDRSVWTDSPAEREARKQGKKLDKEETEVTPAMIASKKRDAELAVAVESYNEKKRAKPLVDLHKIAMAKTTNTEKKERKPFTREDDMCVNKFDDAQKASMLKKAAQLNDRFKGGDRKFL